MKLAEKHICRCEELARAIDILIGEVQELRHHLLPAQSEHIETIIRSAYRFFKDTHFTSAALFECAIDDPELLQAISEVIPRPTVFKLSRFLLKAVGAYGSYRLKLIKQHSRDGRVFCVMVVTESVTF